MKCIAHNPGGWKSEIGVPVWLSEGPLLVTDFLLYLHMVEGPQQGGLWGLFYTGINLIHEDSAIMTKSPPKGHTS